MIRSITDLQEIKKTYEEKMAGYKYQALVCFGTGCTSSGCKVIRDTLIEEIEKYGLQNDVAVIERGCMGTCAVGPVVYILPDETYYTEMTPEKIREIVQKHFIGGEPVVDYTFYDCIQKKRIPNINDTSFFKRQVRIALRNCGLIDVNSVSSYIAKDGYLALARILASGDRMAVIEEMKARRSVTARLRIKSEMTIRTPDEPRKIRVWLPIPCEYAQVRNVKILSVSHPDTCQISSMQAAQRTVCMDGMDDQPFWVEYEYETHMRCMEPDPKHVTEDQPTFYTGEHGPHILFTPYLKSLCAEIVGHETNPLVKARLIYEYITHHIRYSYMRAYFTIPMIPEHAALNQRGDCGVQALLFITLCRIAGIPARWQSGLYTEPGDVGCHDWAQFYVAPYGWLFNDCSFGGSAVRRKLKTREDFYFCNIDPFRMPANAEYQHDFENPPHFMRYDPYDNQLGEAEYDNEPLTRSYRRTHHTLLQISGLDCCRERPEYI